MIFCYFLNIKSRSLMHRMANATRSDGERNPIGRRTQPDRTADGTRLDGGRNPIGRRTESVTKKLHSALLTLSCASSLILAICGIKAIADAQRDATDGVSIVKQCSCSAGIERAVLIAGGE